MIRTSVVNLTVIPAVAYRVKLQAGGCGLVIVHKDISQPGIATVSKTSGEAIPAQNTPSGYPKEAFAEALLLTQGMPYKKLGAVQASAEPQQEEHLPEEVVVDSAEYNAVANAYTDKNGKLSYELINRDMIKLLNRSAVARRMLANNAAEADIRRYVVGAKFRNIARNADMTDLQVEKILEMLDEVSPKGVLKEFNEELRRKLAKK